jgi:hypothetical protein
MVCPVDSENLTQKQIHGMTDPTMKECATSVDSGNDLVTFSPELFGLDDQSDCESGVSQAGTIQDSTPTELAR